MKITISNVEIMPIPQRQTLLGFCSLVINSCLKLSGIAIHTQPNSRKGMVRLVYPAKPLRRKSSNGYLIFYFYPLTKEFSEELRLSIEKKIKEIGLFEP